MLLPTVGHSFTGHRPERLQRPSVPPDLAQRHKCHAPRKTKVNVSKCHACHAKRRLMWASATRATQNESQCEQAPRLPRKTKADVSKRHACHAKRRSMWASATPATQSGAAPRAINGDQARHQIQPSAISTTPNEGGCHQVPHLPCKPKVGVSTRRACPAKWRGAPGD